MVFLEDREEKESRGAETKIQAWKMLGIKKNFQIPDWDLYRKEAWLQVKPKSLPALTMGKTKLQPARARFEHKRVFPELKAFS